VIKSAPSPIQLSSCLNTHQATTGGHKSKTIPKANTSLKLHKKLVAATGFSIKQRILKQALPDCYGLSSGKPFSLMFPATPCPN